MNLVIWGFIIKQIKRALGGGLSTNYIDMLCKILWHGKHVNIF